MGVASASAQPGERIYLVVRTRSIFACLLHWILFTAIMVLAVTGLYIGDPEYYFGRGEAWQAFAMANMRTIHMVAGFTVIAVLLMRFYLSFTSGCHFDLKQILPTWSNISGAVKLAKFFVTLRGPHAHYRFVNPLGGIGVFMMILFMAAQVVTGVLLFLPGADPGAWGWAMGIGGWLERVLGGQQEVRVIHHLAMYLLMATVVIHVYMQIWKGCFFPEADIASIIAGYKVFPRDMLGHFADRYGVPREERIPTPDELDRASTAMQEAPVK